MNIHRELAILKTLIIRSANARNDWKDQVKWATENGDQNAWQVEAALRVHLAMSELVRHQEQRIAEEYEQAEKK